MNKHNFLNQKKTLITYNIYNNNNKYKKFTKKAINKRGEPRKTLKDRICPDISNISVSLSLKPGCRGLEFQT